MNDYRVKEIVKYPCKIDQSLEVFPLWIIFPTKQTSDNIRFPAQHVSVTLILCFL